VLSCDEPVLRSGRTMEAFVEQVGRQTISGYQLALIHGQPEALCVAGFRIHEMLSRRNHMYVDDQVTLESERSKGHGVAGRACRTERMPTSGSRFRSREFRGAQVLLREWAVDPELPLLKTGGVALVVPFIGGASP
jgi:hypothetical protein